MKKIIFIIFLLILFGCKKNLSEKTKEEIIQKEQFWKNRSIMQNKQEKIYPIEKSTTVTEERTNRIYLRSRKCQFEVFVNDVLLLKAMGEITKDGAGINGDFDINQLMLTSGQHEVEVRLYPQYGQAIFDDFGGFMNLTFSHFKNRDLRTKQYYNTMNNHSGIELSSDDQQWITKYNEEYKEEYDGEYKPKKSIKFKGLPIYIWRKTFEADVPFSFVGWRESVNIKEEHKDNEDKVKKELLFLYKRIHEIIKNKNTNAYLDFVKEREELITSCLLYKQNEKPLREKEFIDLIKSDDYELEPLLVKTFHLEFQAYGKLILFLNKIDGEGVIRMKNKKDSNDIIYLDFRFQRKKKEDSLTVI